MQQSEFFGGERAQGSGVGFADGIEVVRSQAQAARSLSSPKFGDSSAFMQPYRNCQLARPCSFLFLLCSGQEFHLSVFLANSALARIHCFNDQLFTCSALMAPVPARA